MHIINITVRNKIAVNPAQDRYEHQGLLHNLKR